MGRAPCCSKVGLHKGPWTPKEDALLVKYIQAHGEGQWRSLPKNAGLLRCGKSCRLRWMNYLRPDIKRGNITADEEDLIIKLHSLLGNRWSLIAKRLPGRTDNEIKNYWNTHLNKRLRNQGIDPNTHKQLSETDIEKSTNNGKRRGISKMSTMQNHAKRISNKSKPNPTQEVGDKRDENENPNDELRERLSKIHLPKPIRVSPVNISTTQNNSHGSSFEATNYVISTDSSGSNSVISQQLYQNPKDELLFEDSENIMLDIPWLTSTITTTSTANMGDHGIDHMMIMGSSSSCGGDHGVNNVDIIQDHDRDYGVDAGDNGININQPLESLYQEYLQLIKSDQYHDVDDVDSFTRSFLI